MNTLPKSPEPELVWGNLEQYTEDFFYNQFRAVWWDLREVKLLYEAFDTQISKLGAAIAPSGQDLLLEENKPHSNLHSAFVHCKFDYFNSLSTITLKDLEVINPFLDDDFDNWVINHEYIPDIKVLFVFKANPEVIRELDVRIDKYGRYDHKTFMTIAHLLSRWYIIIPPDDAAKAKAHMQSWWNTDN